MKGWSCSCSYNRTLAEKLPSSLIHAPPFQDLRVVTVRLQADIRQSQRAFAQDRGQGGATEDKSGRPGAAEAAGPEVPEAPGIGHRAEGRPHIRAEGSELSAQLKGSLLPSLVYGGREFAAAGLAPSLREVGKRSRDRKGSLTSRFPWVRQIYQMFGPTWCPA